MINFKRKNKGSEAITIPMDTLSFSAGDIIDTNDFFVVVNRELDKLNDRVEELLIANENLINEIDDLHYKIESSYKPIDPYTANGVSPRDFH